MSESKRVVIIGGHGKIALLAAPKFATAVWQVDAIIRNLEHRANVEAAGANPVLLDIERGSVDQLAESCGGAVAVVFSAGAGGGNPARTNAVDYEAAARAIDAAADAGVSRLVMVSFSNALVAMKRTDPTDSFYPYTKAKLAADEHLRASALDYTILGPGRLTLEPGSGNIVLLNERGELEGDSAPTRDTSRENVAEVMVHVVTTGAASRKTVNFYDGPLPIAQAIR